MITHHSHCTTGWARACARLAVICSYIVCGNVVAADVVIVTVRTKINAPDPQAGEKSLQTIRIDFDKKSVSQTFTTGSTAIIGGVVVGSVRDNFVISKAADFFADGKVAFSLRGSTASGVGVVPNIDYAFDLVVGKDGRGTMSGCHDGYPAYEVTVQGRSVHSFAHKPVDILRLFGACDIEVGKPTPKAF
jgi:hypothetical protein